MAKWLVTGGAGFIGSHVSDALLSAGHELTIVDDLSTGKRENIPKNAKFIESDFASPDVLDKVLPGTNGILHLAAYIDLARSFREPERCHDINVHRSEVLLTHALRHHVSAFVFSSSAAIYQEANPSPYGRSKLEFEKILEVCSRTHGLRAIALRYFNVYGPRQVPGSQYAAVIPKFISQIKRGEALTIHGRGEQRRDFIHVSDVALANQLAAEYLAAPDSAKPQFHTYDVGTGASTSVLELAEELEKAAQKKVGRVFLDRQPGDADDSTAHVKSVADLKKNLGWSAKKSFSQGLAETFKWAALSFFITTSVWASSESKESFLDTPEYIWQSQFDDLLKKGANVEMGEEFLGTPDVSAPGEYLRALFPVENSPYAIRAGFRTDHINPLGDTQMRFRTGGIYRDETMRYSLDLGFRTGVHGFHEYARIEARGKFLETNKASISAEFATPLNATSDLVRLGVSESKLVLRWERRMDEWTEISFHLTGRLTHFGNQFDSGRGYEFATRVGFGRVQDRWKFGPWAHILRWGATETKNDDLLVHRSSLLGPYLGYVIGGKDPHDLRFRISTGIGKDLAPNPEFDVAFFAESGIEKTFNDSFGCRAAYDYYTAQISQGLGAVTHVASLNLVYRF